MQDWDGYEPLSPLNVHKNPYPHEIVLVTQSLQAHE